MKDYNIGEQYKVVSEILSDANSKLEEFLGNMYIQGYGSIPGIRGGQIKRDRVSFVQQQIEEMIQHFEDGNFCTFGEDLEKDEADNE